MPQLFITVIIMALVMWVTLSASTLMQRNAIETMTVKRAIINARHQLVLCAVRFREKTGSPRRRISLAESGDVLSH